ncbi:MAG TPA: hypothetical protein PKD37_05800 [Oligoflexia bacterium]|nr:hypothetical protein [Oligoflexia bacterium]HMP27476.1 hypothetical protein [Oligoflexia bacterium]
MAQSVRAKVDAEITRHIGKWFTVRQIQEKTRVSPATLKPLIMKYARENLLKRRHVKGTARSVQFTPAAAKVATFQTMLTDFRPYRNVTGTKFGFKKGGLKQSAVTTKTKTKFSSRSKSATKKSSKRR